MAAYDNDRGTLEKQTISGSVSVSSRSLEGSEKIQNGFNIASILGDQLEESSPKKPFPLERRNSVTCLSVDSKRWPEVASRPIQVHEHRPCNEIFASAPVFPALFSTEKVWKDVTEDFSGFAGDDRDDSSRNKTLKCLKRKNSLHFVKSPGKIGIDERLSMCQERRSGVDVFHDYQNDDFRINNFIDVYHRECDSNRHYHYEFNRNHSNNNDNSFTKSPPLKHSLVNNNTYTREHNNSAATTTQQQIRTTNATPTTPTSNFNRSLPPHRCDTCQKAYTSRSALKMHERTHTLPCRCYLCGKAFSRPWLLQGHLRTHTGEKPFSCEQCGRSFADRSNLRAHVLTHTSARQFHCPRLDCRKTFSRLALLEKHKHKFRHGTRLG